MLETYQSKASSLDKTKLRLATEVEDLNAELERANSHATQLDKKQRNFDKVLAEHKCKQDELQVDLEVAQKESRHAQNELFSLKNATEESLDQLESARRENHLLDDELKDIQQQISESNKQLYELEKMKRVLEVNRGNLQTNIEESEAAIETEENKLIRLVTETNQRKQDLERRCAEKEDEAEQHRRNGQRSLETLQTNLDAEIRARGDAVRNRKKMEADFNDMEIALKQANRHADDAQKQVKVLNHDIKDKQAKLDDTQQETESLREQDQLTERRLNLMSTEIEELRKCHEGADRARKQAESELIESNERSNMLHVQNTTLLNQKKKMEASLSNFKIEAEEAMTCALEGEEKAKQALTDAAIMAEELKKEQDQAAHLMRMKKNMESSVKELQHRLDEAEQVIIKGSKRAVMKMEAKIKDLENDLDTETRKTADAVKMTRKAERRYKDVVYQCDEEKKNLGRLQDMVDKLTNKVVFILFRISCRVQE